ncbi:MAG: sugar transferase [Pirellulaceae bacterium]|nr:sugar transferase [Planctomycetales bacterium]
MSNQTKLSNRTELSESDAANRVSAVADRVGVERRVLVEELRTPAPMNSHSLSIDIPSVDRFALPSRRPRPVEWLTSVFDRLAAMTLLCLFFPVMVLVSIVIRLDSKGGAFFLQERIAKTDRRLLRSVSEKLPGEDAIAEAEIRPATFIIYKFRTYRIDADHVVQGRANFEFGDADIGSIHLQLQHDPRVTRVGRFLRRTSLDELPNLINVLRGEMSLVGPRPEVIQMFRHYTTEQRDKFTVKPGITGLAQVNGRGKLNFEQTLRFDLDYVRHRSVWLDLRILFKTIRVVLTGDGSF